MLAHVGVCGDVEVGDRGVVLVDGRGNVDGGGLVTIGVLGEDGVVVFAAARRSSESCLAFVDDGRDRDGVVATAVVIRGETLGVSTVGGRGADGGVDDLGGVVVAVVLGEGVGVLLVIRFS